MFVLQRLVAAPPAPALSRRQRSFQAASTIRKDSHLSLSLLNTFISIGYVFIGFITLAFAAWTMLQKRKSSAGLRSNILKKLQASVELSAKDVLFLGRGYGLSSKSCREAIFKLFADVEEADQYNALKALAIEFEREEPFDDLPDEVKPSMLRLAKLVELSGEPSDNRILDPVTATLNKYTELQHEQKKAKKQTYRAYVITIVSFLVGAVSFYLTWRSPSEADIKKAMQEVMFERTTPSGEAQLPAPVVSAKK